MVQNIQLNQIMSTEEVIIALPKTLAKISDYIVNNFPSPIAKSLFIDGPIYLYYESSLVSALGKTNVAGITYAIRSSVKENLISFGIDKYTAGNTAGFIGGSFKYYVTGQNPIIGALNNAAYETCNNYDFCANDPFVNIPFTLTVEALDAAAQTALKLAEGDGIGAILSAAYGGAKIGSFLALDVYLLYIPALETNALSIAGDNNTCFNTTAT